MDPKIKNFRFLGSVPSFCTVGMQWGRYRQLLGTIQTTLLVTKFSIPSSVTRTYLTNIIIRIYHEAKETIYPREHLKSTDSVNSLARSYPLCSCLLTSFFVVMSLVPRAARRTKSMLWTLTIFAFPLPTFRSNNYSCGVGIGRIKENSTS